MASDGTLSRVLLVLVAAVVLVPLLMMALLMPMMGMWGGGHMWDGTTGPGTGGWWMWLVPWLVVVAVLGGLGYVLFQGVRGGQAGETDRAIEELRSAYARGELTDEEFENRRDRLQRDR